MTQYGQNVAHSTKQQCILLHHGWDANPSQGYPQQYATGTQNTPGLDYSKPDGLFKSWDNCEQYLILVVYV